MEEFKAIEFHEARDFGKKINTVFEFIKQNFKPMGKSILFIAGPAVLIGSIFMGSFFTEFIVRAFNPRATSPEETLRYFSSYSFWAGMAMMYLMLILSYVMSLATINSYAWLYGQKKSNQIEVREVWEKTRSILWTYLGSMLLILVCTIVITLAVAVLAILVQQISTVFMIVLIIVAFIFVIYLAGGISLIFFIQVNEGTGFFEAAARSLKLVSGKWWSTFGISMVLSMIGGAISYIFIIPYYIFMFVSMFNSASAGQGIEMSPTFKTVSFIFLTLYYMSQMLLQSLPSVGLVFQYFNLVELKEAKGLIGDIENFGKPTEDNSRQETY
jgi:hypothetical protein